MRIVVIGDFHMDKYDQTSTAKMIEDVNAIHPDLVIPLGDFGTNRNIGLKAGLEEAYAYLSRLNCPVRPIIGNHDLHFEMGNNMIEKGTFAKAFLDVFGLTSTYDVIEFPSFRLFFVCNDNMPDNIECLSIQECYISEEQLSWIERKLQERPGIPCILFSHAPIALTGLRDIPQVHIRATNAYLNQNFKSFKWMELVKKYKEITMWFSAHYHLGHDHENAYNEKNGTHFFTTGVHSDQTRDGNRHSRVIDIQEDTIAVSTLDHAIRSLKKEPDWFISESIMKLVDAEPEIQLRVKKAMNIPSVTHASLRSRCRLGDDRIMEDGIIATNGERYLLITEKGYLWHIDMEHGGLLGTHHAGKVLGAACITGDYIVKAQSGNLSFIKSTDPQKYIRNVKVDGFTKVRAPGKISAVHAVTNNVFALAVRNNIHIIELDDRSRFHLRSVTEIGKMAICIKGDEEKLYIIDKDHQLYYLTVSTGVIGQISRSLVECIELKDNVLLAIEIEEDNTWFVKRIHDKIVSRIPFKIHLPMNSRVIYKILDENNIIIKIENSIYRYGFVDQEVVITELLSGEFKTGEIYVSKVNGENILIKEFCQSGETYIEAWIF